MDAGVELTMIHAYIDVQKCDFGGGGVPGELDRIATVETFKELGEGVGTMRPKEENVIDKTQLEVGFLESGVKHVCAHGSSLYLEVMAGVKGKMVVRINWVSWIRN